MKDAPVTDAEIAEMRRRIGIELDGTCLVGGVSYRDCLKFIERLKAERDAALKDAERMRENGKWLIAHVCDRCLLKLNAETDRGMAAELAALASQKAK